MAGNADETKMYINDTEIDAAKLHAMAESGVMAEDYVYDAATLRRQTRDVLDRFKAIVKKLKSAEERLDGLEHAGTLVEKRQMLMFDMDTPDLRFVKGALRRATYAAALAETIIEADADAAEGVEGVCRHALAELRLLANPKG